MIKKEFYVRGNIDMAPAYAGFIGIKPLKNSILKLEQDNVLIQQCNLQASTQYYVNLTLLNAGNISITVVNTNNDLEGEVKFELRNLGARTQEIKSLMKANNTSIVLEWPLSRTKLFGKEGTRTLDGAKLTESFENQGYMEGKFSDQMTKICEDVLRDLNKFLELEENKSLSASSDRIEHMHSRFESFAHLIHASEIKEAISKFTGVEMACCQSLTFVNGSQQGPHSDHIHLTPSFKNSMVGVWIPLENVSRESGPLFYYPGSHKLFPVTLDSQNCSPVSDNNWQEFGEKIVAKFESDCKKFSQKHAILDYGEYIIWSSNLLHGGSQRLNMKSTRKSVVLHFFEKELPAIYESTGLPAVFGEEFAYGI